MQRLVQHDDTGYIKARIWVARRVAHAWQLHREDAPLCDSAREAVLRLQRGGGNVFAHFAQTVGNQFIGVRRIAV